MFKRIKGKLCAIAPIASLAVLSAGSAMATTGPGSLTTAFTGGYDEAVLWAVGVIVLGAAGVIFMVKRSQRATN